MPSPIQTAFDMMDGDNSGTLDRNEVKQLVELMGKEISETELDEAMRELDTGGDGQVDFKEFEVYWQENFDKGGGLLMGIIRQVKQMKPVEGEAFHPDRYVDEDEEFRARTYALFAMIDRNKDLNLDAAEFAKFLDKQGVDVPSNLEDKMKEFDTNGNGTVDKDELAGVIKGLNLQDIVPSIDDTVVFFLKEREKELRANKTKNPKVYNHPVWRGDYAFPDLEIDETEITKFKELFAMVDTAYAGFLGHRQFTDLLKLLGIEVTEEQLKHMFEEMDKDDDGQIEFDEFVPGIVHNVDKEQLYALEHIQLGACGTRAWSRGEILWAANTGMIIVSIGVFISALIYFQFMLVPLTSAYFFVFLFSPIMNILMFRPIECGPVRCCDPWEEDPEADEDKLLHYPYGKRRASEGRREMEGAKASCMDIFTLAMVPPGLALLVTMVVVFAGFGLLVSLISGEVGALLADEAFMQKLTDFVDQLYVDMNSSGVKVLRYSGPEGYTAGEIGGFIGQFGDFFNQVALIFLLTIYVMSEKTMPTLFSPTNKIMMEIETQVMGYISLKTALSFVTGVIVAIILLVLGVKLAIMFGLLSFVLNFIPNVGSMIAMFLPLPIVIVDDGLATWQKIGSFVGPGIVQGYVGNALEPMVFGKSLNMTPLSILAALVIWSAMWGLMGAIFSVPLLGIMKILLTHTNHPMAKYVIMLIREDATVDEQEQAVAANSKFSASKDDDDEAPEKLKVENPAAMD